MMITVKKTIYADALIAALISKKNYNVLPNTTINEKFGVNITTGETSPTHDLKYFTIGIGGSVQVDTEENKKQIALHSGKSGCLIETVPFITVPTANDLSPAEQSKYRLKVPETINGVSYFSYYLKVLETDFEDRLLKIKNENGVNILSGFNSNDPEILNPVARTRSDNDLDKLSYLASSMKKTVLLSEVEVNKIHEALSLRYGDGSNKMITEFGLMAGKDMEVDDVLHLKEISYTQLMFSFGSDYEFQKKFKDKSEIVFELDVGGMSPIIE